MRASDLSKDQTYYLSSITESSLDKALFPLANISKTQVRKIAHAADLHNASREESMGLCFVGERRRFNDFLGGFLPQTSAGDLVETNPRFLGRSRRGLRGASTRTDSRNRHTRSTGPARRPVDLHHRPRRETPRLVQEAVRRRQRPSKECDLRLASRVSGGPLSPFPCPVLRLIVACARSHPALFTSIITSNNFSWIWRDPPPSSAFLHEGFRASVQIRHRTTSVPVTVRQRWSDDALQITFAEPLKAVAQGQVAVLYDDDHCLGCGTIDGTTSTASLGGSR